MSTGETGCLYWTMRMAEMLISDRLWLGKERLGNSLWGGLG